jgi:hypothetical protein
MQIGDFNGLRKLADSDHNHSWDFAVQGHVCRYFIRIGAIQPISESQSTHEIRRKSGQVDFVGKTLLL